MAHKILMLGGFRSGKSSILASILHALDQKTCGDLFTISDQTDYTSTKNAAVRLEDKRLEISQYLKLKNKVVAQDPKFLVDMNPTQDFSVYKLTTRIRGAASVDFEFVDIAGEYMEETHEKYNDLKKMVDDSDVFVIAIDSPYMMETDDDTNRVYNRTVEITKVLNQIGDSIKEPDLEKKLVIFCPVKCETWVRPQKPSLDDDKRHGHADDILTKVKQSYKSLINTLVKNKGIELWVMPIQTVGALEFVETTDAYRYYRNNSDTTGTRCSYDHLTGVVRLEDGRCITEVNKDQEIYEDKDSTRNNGRIAIPYAWYRLNEEKKYSPVFCEQPAYHILRFLVNKELAQIRRREEIVDKGPIWLKIWSFFVDPPFGEYIEKYQKAVQNLENNGNIKESGDGFARITDIIP